MENRVADLTFEEWIRHLFAHEVSDPAWHFDMDAAYWDGPPTLTILYMTRLFLTPHKLLQEYTDAQLNQGLWYIANNACSNHMFAAIDESVPLHDRVACIKAMFPLYRNLFAAKCSPHLGHRNEAIESPLNSVCYMWWDLLPFVGDANSRSRRELDAAALEAMRLTLDLNSVACQEGALHGLGHWAGAYPTQVKRIIEEFLKKRTNLREELRQYAMAAKTGCVL